MRLLHTCFTYWPCADGVAIVMQRISEGLAARGHDVTVATARVAGRSRPSRHNGVRIVEFDISGNEVEGFRGDVDGYRSWVASFNGDVMFNYAAQICTTDLVFPLLDDLPFAKVIAPCGYSRLGNPRYSFYFNQMPTRLRKYQAAIYHSAVYQDKKFSDMHGLTNATIIPNGASRSEFERPRTGFRAKCGIEQSRLILSVGNLMDLKGQKDVLDAFRSASVSDCALVFIGSEISRYVVGAMRTPPGPLFDLRRKANILRHELVESRIRPSLTHTYEFDAPAGSRAVVFAGVPREDVLAAYHEADLFVFGSHLECSPLVILEAMASGTPWISYPVGNVPELPGGVLVRDIEEMARAIRELVSDESERKRLGGEGREAWLKRYTWEAIVPRYEMLFLEVSGNA